MIRLINRWRYRLKCFLQLLLLLPVTDSVLNAQDFSIILGRPTYQSITLSIHFQINAICYLEYGTDSLNLRFRTNEFNAIADIPNEIDLINLAGDTRYFYRLNYKLKSNSNFRSSSIYNFHTQRAIGSEFRFTIEADEHLYDKKGIRSLYQICLANQLASKPDFMISLGDTFGDDHTPDETTSEDMKALHKDYLQYLGNICHSVPFFFCLGNHEGENGYFLKQNPPENIAVYGTIWRKFYYPNPIPNHFYSGNQKYEEHNIGLPENYYAFKWGDAHFIILDVYRDCDINEKPKNWDWTLGRTQYDWFKSELEKSNSKYKFVFAHHTRGQGRGGAITANGYEWGGYSGENKNNYEFDKYRPGWGLPIHELMVKYGVQIFFQGHDHLYAKEILDGVIYQEVPMPSDTSYKIGVLANADAYTDVILDGSGHIEVNVSPTCLKIQYISAALPKDENENRKNGSIAHSYTIGSCATSTIDYKNSVETHFQITPNPVADNFTINLKETTSTSCTFEFFELTGGFYKLISIAPGNSTVSVETALWPPGIYIVKYIDQIQKLTIYNN